MIKSDREAIRKYYKQGMNKLNKNNAILQRLQGMAQTGDADRFYRRSMDFLKIKIAKRRRISKIEANLYAYAVDYMKKAIDKNHRKDVNNLDSIIKYFRIYYEGKLDKTEAERYEKGKAAIKKAEKTPGRYLSAPRTTGGEPKVITKDVKQTKETFQDVKKEIVKDWEILLKDYSIAKDEKAKIDVKELFNDVLKQGKIIKKGSDEPLKVMIIQNFLKDNDHYDGDLKKEYDQPTHDAVKEYQTKKELAKDGRVGRQTFMNMYADQVKDPLKQSIPISGNEIDAEAKKDMERILADAEKEIPGDTTIQTVTKASVTPDKDRKVKTGDRKQRGLNPEADDDEELEEIVLSVNESRLRQVIRKALLKNNL